jgi:hypothetical protein
MMRMGAVFKTQEGAFIGARTALMAYRTGEVDVATATQQLTQIQTGMGASAQDLADIFDRLNYVQNNYGARIPDLLDGTSKLSAAWRQAGGDADYLVAIITAMNRTAGVSGAQAATILGRTIGNIAKASSAGTLRRYGITPDQTDIMSTIDQAIKVAQRPGTKPARTCRRSPRRSPAAPTTSASGSRSCRTPRSSEVARRGTRRQVQGRVPAGARPGHEVLVDAARGDRLAARQPRLQPRPGRLPELPRRGRRAAHDDAQDRSTGCSRRTTAYPARSRPWSPAC